MFYILQRFFGTVRMASGANDHPATPTFLQVYKLLSVYSIIKPPKYGNCSINIMDPGSNLIRLSDIKSIYHNDKKSPTALENLKNKLDTLIDDGTWEFTDIIEHDYAHAQVIDCLKYYITGYLCFQIGKKTQCVICKQAFVTHLPPKYYIF